MNRFLTPSKLGLLSLVSLYCDATVPSASTVPVLAFLVSYVLPQGVSTSNPLFVTSRKSEGPLISISDFEHALITHPSASGVPGRTMWDLFVKQLWEINSLDALFVFFEHLKTRLVKPISERQRDVEQGIDASAGSKILLSRTSPLGTFVRRAHLEFSRMQIHDTVALWKAFIVYRQPSFATWQKRNPTANDVAFDSIVDQWNLTREDRLTKALYGDLPEVETETDGMASTEEIERLLQFQIEEIQKIGTRVPDAMKARFRSMLEGNVTIPNLSHYLKFLDSWKAGDYPSSFDNLHRYFDYNMFERDRHFYQYALLNLASLQADFGCYDEAIAAIHETISTARENKDVSCLNYSLNWLYLFGKAHPKEMSGAGRGMMLEVEREGLAFLKTKAKDTGMWSLWSSTLLSEAQLRMTTGDSISLVFENILKSSHLLISKNTGNNFATQISMLSTLWARLGVTHLAWSSCETFFQCYGKKAALQDVLTMTCRSASLLMQKGSYEEATAQLMSIDRECLRTLKNYQYWTAFYGLLKLKRELCRNNLDAAEYLLNQFQSPEVQDSATWFEFEILHIDYLARRSSFDDALSRLESLASTLEEENRDIYLRVRLLTLKAFLLDRCGVSQKGFSVAVRAASIAWRARLMPALWHALCAIGNVLIQLKEFDAAAKVLGAIMPQLLECEDSELSALAYSLLVDAYVGQAGLAESESPHRKDCLAKASEHMEHAFAEYARIEEFQKQCEMMAKKATIMQLMGDFVLANDYAAKYLELKKGS
ncbi:MAG: Anaphase-promoting complex subunit 5 [Sclerophora amabilis]|nr:MAG: Anaphase-promoting complex subunit 5 [Sclerophora amabilis]